MGRIKIILSVSFFMFSLFALSQANLLLNIEHERSIPGNYSKIYVDNLGNIFAIADNNIQIKKMSANGDSLQLSDKLNQYGNIYSLDVSNPLKLLVYYKDFTTVLQLDRFLNAVNTVDFRQAGIMQASAVASSYDSKIWVYDEQTAQIKKVDANGAVSFASTDLRTVFDQAPQPSKIIDNNGQLYLYDKNTGWLLFDYYGGFKQKIDYVNWEDVGVTNNILFGRTSDTIWMYNPKKIIAQTYIVSLKMEWDKVKQMIIQNNKMYILNKQEIAIYDIKQ